VHWQITPTAMTHMLSDPDREAAVRAQAAMMGMKKIDIAAMQLAFEGANPEQIMSNEHPDIVPVRSGAFNE
jgi:hypothetical protein